MSSGIKITDSKKKHFRGSCHIFPSNSTKSKHQVPLPRSVPRTPALPGLSMTRINLCVRCSLMFILLPALTIHFYWGIIANNFVRYLKYIREDLIYTYVNRKDSFRTHPLPHIFIFRVRVREHLSSTLWANFNYTTYSIIDYSHRVSH